MLLRQLLRLPDQRRAFPSNGVRARAFASSAGVVASFVGSLLKPVGIGYALTLAIAVAAQRKLQYFPAPEAPQHPSLMHGAFADIEEHEVWAADGTRLLLWHWPAPAAGTPAVAPWFLGDVASDVVHRTMTELRASPSLRSMDVLLFHGNAGHRGHRLPWALLLREGLGCSVTVIDYRGYGGSSGSPTERGLIEDGRAAYEWLRMRQQRHRSPPSVLPRQLVLWGESIGSGVALGLLDAECAHGTVPQDTRLVLEAGFTSCVDLGAHAYPWLPVRLGMLDRFDSVARARRIAERTGGTFVPSLSLHGELDEIAPLKFGEGLHSALPGTRKRLVVLPATGHNDVPFANPVRYLKEVAAFLSDSPGVDVVDE